MNDSLFFFVCALFGSFSHLVLEVIIDVKLLTPLVKLWSPIKALPYGDRVFIPKKIVKKKVPCGTTTFVEIQWNPVRKFNLSSVCDKYWIILL